MPGKTVSTSTYLGAALAGTLMLCAATSANATLYYSEDSNSNGLFSLNTTTGAATLVGSGITTVSGSTVGLAPSANPSQLWGSKPFGLLNISSDGSGAATTGNNGMEGLGFDPNTGMLYYAINGGFGTVNTGTGVLAPLAAPGADVEGLAFGRGGIFGLDTASNLSFYNIGLNSWSLIGATGLSTGFNKGLAYDPTADILYAIDGQSANLYSLNADNGASSIIGSTGRGAAQGGLAFVSQVPEPTTLALMGLGLAGIGYRRKRKLAA